MIKNLTNPLLGSTEVSPSPGETQEGMDFSDLECVVVDPPRE